MSTPAIEPDVRDRLQEGKQWRLDGRDIAWKIESGSVDVFLVDTEEGEIASRLFYVGTWRDGETVCGVGTVAMEKGRATLLARGSLDVSLQTMNVSSLSEEQIDRWITKISHLSVTERPPSTSLPAEAGSSYFAEEDALTLIGTHGVVWVSGDAVLLAGHTQQVAKGWVPLTRYLWATVTANSSAACISTREWLRQSDAINADLTYLHRTLLHWLIRKRSEAAAASNSRFEKKIHEESFLIREAMAQLTSPLARNHAARHSHHAAHRHSVVECCRLVARSLGMEISAVGVEVQGASPEQMVRRLAEANGIRSRKVLLRHGWWNEDNGPMIGFSVNGSSAIALLRKGKRYVAVDSVAKAESVVDESFAEGITMHAYVFYRRLPEGRQSPWQMLRFGLRTTQSNLQQLVLVSLLLSLLGLILPLATGVIFEDIIPEGEARRLASLSVLLFAASVASFLIRMGQSYLTLSFEGRLEMELQAAVWDRLLRLPLSFFRRDGAVNLGLKSLAITQVRQVLGGTALTSCLAVLFSLMNIALLFYYSVRMALFVSLVTIVLAIFFVALSYQMVQRRRTVMQMEMAILSRVSELIQGVAKLRSSGNEARGFGRWARIYAERTQAMMSLTRTMLSLKVLTHIFPPLSLIVIFLAAGQLLREGVGFTTGQLLAFYAALGQFLAGVQRLSTTAINLAVAVPVYERLQPILDEPLENRRGVKHAGRLEGRIEFSHVSFRYGSRGPMVLQDISFTVMPGEFVAVVGESGSGKSTLLRLLLGFETLNSGSIAYDGRDLAGLDQQQVRRQIGTVLQRDSLMPSDLVSNILGGSGLSIDHAWEAARSVGLEDEIRAMPMGMHTVVNDTASGISGGQKQRLLIARAIVQRPRILFFDEATSALDNQTQAIVGRSLHAMQATRIVIAHRLSTIVQADRILVLRDGKVHADGSYAELLERDEYFTTLAAGQTR